MDSFSSKSTDQQLKSNAKTRGLPVHLFKGIFSPSKTETTNAMTRSSLKQSPSTPTLFWKLDPREHRGIEVTKRDIALIHHNSKLTDRVQSPIRQQTSPSRRNPILQNADEPVMEVKSSIKTSGKVTKTTIFDEPKEIKKVVSEKNWKSRIFETEPDKPIRIREPPRFSGKPMFLEGEARLQASKSPTRVSRNPIVQEETLVDDDRIRVRAYDNNDDSHHKRINDNKEFHLRPVSTTRGKVFRDSNINFGYDPKEDDAKPLNRQPPNAIKKKMNGRMGSLISNEYGMKFRDEGLASKVNTVPFASLTDRNERDSAIDHLVEQYDF